MLPIPGAVVAPTCEVALPDVDTATPGGIVTVAVFIQTSTPSAMASAMLLAKFRLTVSESEFSVMGASKALFIFSLNVLLKTSVFNGIINLNLIVYS